MLIAVTGATGFIGHYIVNRLLGAGHMCRCWHRAASDRGGFDAAGEGRLEWLEGGLGDAGAAEALVRGADAVVHSALHHPGGGWSGSEGDLPEFVETNVLGSVRLMHAARAAGVGRFVFVSTCAVHDVILDDRPLDEAHPLWPRSHYGAHKAALEAVVHSYGLGDGWPICAVRPTGVYGVRRPIEASKWFSLVRDVAGGKPIDSPRGGKEVHAADVAKAVDLLLHAPADAIAGQSFNCYDLYVADQDVAAIAKELTGPASTIADRNKGPKHQIETGKIRSLGMTFGGCPLLRQTVRAMVEAVRRPGTPAADTPPSGSRASAR
jgi:nucleoside-diphosphate-sugar epimerase